MAYKFIAIILVVVLALALCAPVFGAGLAASAVDMFSAIWSVYAGSRGFGQVLTTDGVLNNADHIFDKATYQSLYESLYNEYNGLLDSSGQMTIDDWVANVLDVSSSAAPPSYGTAKTVLTLSAKTVQWFDAFATWLLDSKLVGTVSDSGHYHTSGNFADSTIAAEAVSGSLSPILLTSSAQRFNGQTYYLSLSSTTPNTYAALIGTSSSNYPILFNVSSVSPSISFQVKRISNDSVVTSFGGSSGFVSSGNIRYRFFNNPSDVYTGLPIYSSIQDFLAHYADPPSEPVSYKIQLTPQDKYNQRVKGKDGEVVQPGDVYVPNPAADDYMPAPLTGTLDIPYSETQNGLLDVIKDLINDKSLINQPVLEVDIDAPTEPVYTPLLPFSLPSFNFNFSGIWHYVVEWVSSVGSGAAQIFAVWSYLPYALVLPVYASLVVVIVLGVYKRFFM